MALPNILEPTATKPVGKTSGLPSILEATPSAPIPKAKGGLPNILEEKPVKSPFATVTPKGVSIGFSDEKDASGKSFLAYRNPGDTSTTTDKTRVATEFDPRVATKLDPKSFYTPRAVADRANLKQAMGGSYSDQLDHRIALELSGSNDKSNLGIEKLLPGSNKTKTDPLENTLARQVASGKKSLFDAQAELAKVKNLPTPFTGADNSKHGISDDSTLGIVKNTLLGLPKAALDFVGVGKILDFLKTPEGEEAASNLDWSDLAHGFVPGVGQAILPQFLDFAGKPMSVNVPGVGEIQNIQKTAYDAVQNGENPYVAIVKSVPGAIFDGLLIAGAHELVFGDRPTVVGKADLSPEITPKSPVKSFRVNTPASSAQQLPGEYIRTIAEQKGFTLPDKFDPKLPTFLRMTENPTGGVTGEIVQVKPSYFKTFVDSLKGNISKVPEKETLKIYSETKPMTELVAPKAETPVAEAPKASTGLPNILEEKATSPEDLQAIRKANPMLFSKAQKATNVDEFINSVVKYSKTTRENVSIPSLTDFYNKIKGKPTPSDNKPAPALPLSPPPREQASTKSKTSPLIPKASPTATALPNPNESVVSSPESTPQADFVKTIGSKEDSAEIAKSSETKGFEYNPESGFVSVKPIVKAVENVSDFIKETNRGTKASGNLDDSLYVIQKEAEADKIMAMDLIKKTNITPADAEAIYHFEEDKNASLTDHQKEIYENAVRPLAEATDKIVAKLKPNIPLNPDDYTPRFVKGRGNVLDRIVTGAKNIGGRGTPLLKSAPSLKKRTMKVLVDAKGNRTVVSIKGDRVTAIKNKISQDMGSTKQKSNEGNPKDKFTAKDGKKYTIADATTKEIEANTHLTYHKNVLANRLVTYLNLRAVERATDFLESYKESPEFKSIGQKFGEGEAPTNWTTTVNPSFRGYMLDPHVAEVMDKYASSMMKPKDPLRVLTAMNSFLRTAIFFNPLIHIPNIGVHWLVNRGALSFANPKAYKTLAETSARAINAVVHQNQDYVDMLRSGAPLLYSSQETRNFHNALLAKMTNEVDKNPALDFLKKALKNINPYVISGKATWMVNDILTMQAIYEEMAKGRTAEEAIKDVGAHIPTYRLPANKFVQLLSNPNITMFGAYHYGALRSYVEMAKTLVTGDTAGRPKQMVLQPDGSYSESAFSKEAWKNRAETLDKIVMLGIIALVIYPEIDKALKKVTGNPNAHIRRAGAVTFPYNITKTISGDMNFSQLLQSVITPAPATKEGFEQLFNIDTFTADKITQPGDTGKDQAKERGAHIVKSISPVAQFSKVNSGSQTLGQFLESLVGISNAKDPSVSTAYSLNADRISKMTEIKKLRAAGKVDEAETTRTKFNAAITEAVNKAREAQGKSAYAGSLKGLLIPKTWQSTTKISPIKKALK